MVGMNSSKILCESDNISTLLSCVMTQCAFVDRYQHFEEVG
jgi:hypothetical protein